MANIKSIEKRLEEIEKDISNIKKSLDLDVNATIEVKDKDKHGDYILGKKKPMKVAK